MCNAVDTLKQHNNEHTTVHKVVAQGTGTLVAPRDQNRVSLILNADGAVILTWRFGGNDAANDAIVLAVNASPVVLSLNEHGDLVRGPWFCAPAGGPQTVHAVSSTRIGDLGNLAVG